MKEKCSCGGKAINVKPPKFSIDDAYGSYRRKAKSDFFKNEGLL